MKKNIFIINHYAGSPEMGMEYRPYYLAKQWTEMGHNVTILAASYSHLRRNNPTIASHVKEEIIDGISYIWIKTPEYDGNGISRVKNMYVFIRKTLYKASYFVNSYKPDVVIASSTYPSDNYVARKMCKLSKAKHIYEVHDLWPLSPKELGDMSRYHPFIVAMQHAENFAYRNADAVISLLPETQEHMKSHGLNLNKWHYIPNGIVLEDWRNPTEIPPEHKKLFETLKSENKFIIGYTGGHAISNALDTLIETAIILKNNHDIAFVLVGDGTEKEALKQKAKALDNFYFLEPVTKSSIPNILKEFDILYIGWKNNPLYRFGINPNKIFDYMMAEKPIIHAVNAPNTFVKESGCGIAVEPENPKAIANAIMKLTKTAQDKLTAMGQNGKAYVLKHHNYNVLAKDFINIVEQL